MREAAADGRDVAHAHIGERAQRARDHRRVLCALRRSARAPRAASCAPIREVAVRLSPRSSECSLRSRAGSRAARPEHAGLHHQHQRGAAGDRPHRRIVGIEQRDRLRRAWRGSASSNGVMARPLLASGSANAACKPRRELLLHLPRLRAQHRLAEAAELSGQGGIDRIGDLGLVASLGQRGQRGRGQAADDAERRCLRPWPRSRSAGRRGSPRPSP